MNGQEIELLVEMEHLGPEDGLLGKRVHQVHQDKNGILWIITTEGLNRYDGKNFKGYPEFASKNYFTSSRSIWEDAFGYLWIFEFSSSGVEPLEQLVNTATGLAVPYEEAIKKDLPFRWKDVVDVFVEKGGSVHFLLPQGIYSYDRMQSFTFNKFLSNQVSYKIIGREKNGNFWLESWTTKKGLSLKRVTIDGRVSSFSIDYPPKSIRFAETSSGIALILVSHDTAQIKHKIWLISGQKEQRIPFLKVNEIPFEIRTLFSQELILNENSSEKYHLFCSSELGLSLFTAQGEQYTFMEEFQSIRTLPNHFLNTTPNIIWLSTVHGIFKIHFQKSKFKQLLVNYDMEKFDLSCRGITKNADGKLVANCGKPVILNDDQTKIYIDNLASAIAVEKDRAGNLWFGSDDKIFRYSRKGILKEIPLTKLLGRQTGHIWSIYPDRYNNIWFAGDFMKGYYIPETGSVESLKWRKSVSVSSIYKFQRDQEGNLWACTNLGLALAQEDLMTLSLEGPTMDAEHFYQDTSGIFWIAGKNLIRWDRRNNTTRAFTVTDGMQSSRLHAIYPDDYGDLWISSESGIIQFNTTNYDIKRWTEVHGLSNNEFNRISHFQDEEGRIYFGGINGINYFHPKDFQEKNSIESENEGIVITGFEQFSSRAGKVIDLMENLVASQLIKLFPRDRFFRIEFALPHYVQNAQIEYDYRILGNHNDWVNIRESYLQVNGLPYGNYTLEIRGRYPNGLYAKKQLSIPIQVLWPFYLQWWFIFILLIIIIGIIAATIQHIKALRIKNERLAILNQKNESKNSLLAIIAHDLKGPAYSFNNLTKNLAFLIKKEDPKKIEKLAVDFENAGTKLYYTFENLLNWVTSQKGNITSKKQNFDLEALLNQVVESLNFQNQTKQVEVSYDLHNKLLTTDREILQIILFNLLNNAIKYSGVNGKILIKSYLNTTHNIIEVIDYGTGMDSATLIKIEKNEIISTRGTQQEKGYGIGLKICFELIRHLKGQIKIESELEKGSTCSILLPKMNNENGLN